MTSASPTGPATRSIVIVPALEIARERVVDAPDGAEQADERRRAADRRQRDLPVAAVAASTACRLSRSRRVSCEASWPACRRAMPRRLEPVAASSSGSSTASRSKAPSCTRAASRSGAAQNAGTARAMSRRDPAQQPAFPEDQHPGADRHREQQQRHRADDAVALLPELQQRRRMSAVSMRCVTAAALSRRHRAPPACRTGRSSRVGQETRRAQAALGIGAAARALVGDLDALAGAGEQHGVVADDVAAADGGKADRRRIALAGHAFAAVDRAVARGRGRARRRRPRPSAARCRSARRPCGGGAPR